MRYLFFRDTPGRTANVAKRTAIIPGLLMLMFLMHADGLAQSPLPRYPDSLFSGYYHQKVSQFKDLPKTQNDIIFLGNSITDGGEWGELFRDDRVKNRGISGDVTKGVLNRIGQIIDRNPSKVFLLIGVNDLAAGAPADTVFNNILRMVSLFHEYLPMTKVYVQSIFPVNKVPGKYSSHVNKGKQIVAINKRLQEQAETSGFVYVNIHDALADDDGALDLRYTNDGLHLLGSGYRLWKHVVYPYVYDLQAKPSLIPGPQSLVWSAGAFPVYRCAGIAVSDDSLKALAAGVQRMLKDRGIKADLTKDVSTSEPVIELRIGKVPAPLHAEEAYSLSVTDRKVTVTGNTLHGVFNGIQTLRQLMRDGSFIDGCHIRDWPAFAWRGYMVDVGRNYQSVQQLKEQIDVMSYYKLNVFHFHLTENIAWRLQIKRYPQLTEAKNMTRNEGQYYTTDEMQELIAYCKERYITLMPEIDMPGHSAAFQRAMGTDMQSDSGLMITKHILKEVDSTYDVPYIHIGADEVIITNERFIPEVSEVIRRKGKRTMGWKPGGNYDDQTIRQMWNWQNPKPDVPGIYFVDSRDLYLDGMDPLAGVIQIFNKRICDADVGSKYLLGGEICAWNDIRLKSEEDFLTTNPIYPAMVTFGERSWCGGGYKTKLTAFETDTSARFRAFLEFEDRLSDHKTVFFAHQPFSYARQTNIRWKLFGPFDNKGNTSSSFWPESMKNIIPDSTPGGMAIGGTIVVNEFLKAMAKDSTEHPKPNTTWYAYSTVYSQADTIGDFWIDFYNVGRSLHVATPKLGDWDRKGGKVWINGEPVSPPHWTYPGRRGEQETPLVDEGYAYRPANRVPLKKGWNTILVKAPIAGFSRLDWLDPVRWMFTVVSVTGEE